MSTEPPPGLAGDWYLEDEEFGYVQGLRLRARLLDMQTPFQSLQVLETDLFGRALVLDGALQTTERDEFMYHEMLVHVPLLTHPQPRRVLIIGGGDGGALRRALQHPETEVVQVEIDAEVIEACKRYLPAISAGAFDDPRARVVIADGFEFVAQHPGEFDVVMIDSTDPVGPAVPLFEEPFYRDVARCLAEDGLMAAQSSSPLFMQTELQAQLAHLRRVFPIVRTYVGLTPGYPGGLWSYTIGSKRYDPCAVSVDQLRSRLGRLAAPTRYYTPEVHQAAFALPRFIAEVVGEGS